MKTQNRYAFTGRMRVGKDYTAHAIDGVVLGFADPFYEIARNLFPGVRIADKDKIPGLRQLYQELGQLGRGELSESYPLSLSRAVIVDWWRHNGDRFCSMPINWTSFGSNPRIWADCLLARVEQYLTPEEYPPDTLGEPIVQPSGIVCVTNVRFGNERDILRDADWSIWHIMASRQTWEDRLVKTGIRPDDPKLQDTSEQLAIKLDQQILDVVRRQPVGPRFHVIWNDIRPAPSERFFTLQQFTDYVKQRKPSARTPATPDVGVGPDDVSEPAPDSATGIAGDRNSSARQRARGTS